MSRPSDQFDYMSLGDVEESLADKPRRSEKWAVYRRLASLRHYGLIDRDTALIDVLDRTGEAWASRHSLEGLDAIVDLPVLDVSIPLAESYADVLSA